MRVYYQKPDTEKTQLNPLWVKTETPLEEEFIRKLTDIVNNVTWHRVEKVVVERLE